MWVIIAALVSFALIFILMSQKVPFGVSVIIGSTLLGLLTLSIQELSESTLKAIVDPATIELAAAVALISSLGFLYQETEKLREMTESLEKIIPERRVITMIVPALFGLLPMRGGALLSAPVLNFEGEKLGMGNDRKAFVNLWFRHVLKFINPVSSLIVLTAYLSGVSAPLLAMFGLPTCITYAILGYIIGLRKFTTYRQEASRSKEAVENFLLLTSPIMITIILSIVAGLKTFISVAFGLFLLILISRPRLTTIYSAIRKAGLPRMVLATVAAMIFRSVIYSSKLPETVANLAQGASIPWIILVIAIPLSLGVSTGTTEASIAISIPILSAMTSLNFFSIGLIYSFALLGYIISPLHMCLIVTNEYFKTKTIEVYHLLIPAALVAMTLTTLITSFFILR